MTHPHTNTIIDFFFASDFTESICKETLVAVLDIRNVFGFAFSFTYEWSNVHFMMITDEVNGNMSINMPASLLFNRDKSLRNIGYMAQRRYFEEKDDGNANDFYYFHQVATVFETTKVCLNRKFNIFCKAVAILFISFHRPN